MKDAIQHIINLAISCLLVAIILSIISSFLKLRNDYAMIENNSVESTQKMQKYYEFNKYDGNEHSINNCSKDLNGQEIIEVIRKYCKEEKIFIYVDSDNLGMPYLMDYNTYLLDSDKVALAYLKTIFASTDIYHPFLIYNDVGINGVTDFTNPRHPYSIFESGNQSKIAKYISDNSDNIAIGICFVKLDSDGDI